MYEQHVKAAQFPRRTPQRSEVVKPDPPVKSLKPAGWKDAEVNDWPTRVCFFIRVPVWPGPSRSVALIRSHPSVWEAASVQPDPGRNRTSPLWWDGAETTLSESPAHEPVTHMSKWVYVNLWTKRLEATLIDGAGVVASAVTVAVLCVDLCLMVIHCGFTLTFAFFMFPSNESSLYTWAALIQPSQHRLASHLHTDRPKTRMFTLCNVWIYKISFTFAWSKSHLLICLLFITEEFIHKSFLVKCMRTPSESTNYLFCLIVTSVTPKMLGSIDQTNYQPGQSSMLTVSMFPDYQHWCFFKHWSVSDAESSLLL